MAAPTTFQPSPAANVPDRLKAQCKRFSNAWFNAQPAHSGGKYSIERMLAFEEYSRNTSMIQVFLVCIGVPIFVVLLVLCQEIVPLQDPADGWRANYGFWFRVGLVGAGISNAASLMTVFWLDISPLSRVQGLAYCLWVGVGYILAGVVVAELWVFPIPFFIGTLSVVSTTIILTGFLVVIGTRGLRQILAQREKLSRLNRLGSLQGLLYIIYPAYQAIFNEAAHTHYELPVLLVLPVLRVVIRMVFASAAAWKEDMMPTQVVFNVDFFDAFYLVTFIPTASPVSIAVIMLFDLAESATELRELHQQTRRIVGRIRDINDIPEDKNLLAALGFLCNSTEMIQCPAQRQIRVRSCIYHQLSDKRRALLDKYERNSTTANGYTASYQHNLRLSSIMSTISPYFPSIRFRRWLHHTTTVMPATSAAILPNAPRIEDIPDKPDPKYANRKSSVVTNSTILHEALEVLFTSECLILSEYLEVFVPVVYGVFLLTVVNLPNAQYHTEMIGITRENVFGIVSRIFLCALMEFGSFVGLVVITKRNCRINALYQLAFVLETQMMFVQSTLVMWFLATLTYRVVHFGADFTFQFEWTHT